MISLTTLQSISSDDHSKLELTLRSFLEGKSSLSQLKKALEGYLTIDFASGSSYRHIHNNRLPETIRISVEKQHLQHMLQKYVLGEISEVELSDWAACVLMLEVFIPEGNTEEERSEAGDGPIWDIIQRLATPSIFDGLDINIAQDYLKLIR